MSVIEIKFRNDECYLQKHHLMTTDEAENQISKYGYDELYASYRNIKDEKVAENVQFPPVNYVFYAYIFNYKKIPSPEQLIESYFDTYDDQIQMGTNDISYKGINCPLNAVNARILRTYPSLVRDFHFFLLLNETKAFDNVIYSCKNDINGKDILIKHNGKEYEISLFVDTKRSRFYKVIKNIKRHIYASNEIQVALDMSKARKCGDFYLYDNRDTETIKKKIL